MRDLTDIRKEIDRIDNSIKELYIRRMDIAREVAAYKLANNMPVYDRERELSKIENLTGDIEDTALKGLVGELFLRLMSDSRRRQHSLLDIVPEDTFGFSIRDTFDFSNARVIYQGEPGAYSQAAAEQFFGTVSSIANVGTWKDAMEAVRDGKADFCVLPIENSTAGFVTEIYDLLAEYDLTIIGEQVIPIEHMLLSVEGAGLEGIRTVYSHPQALAQCSEFLGSLSGVTCEKMINTAAAAKKVKEDADPTQAAIAGSVNARIYGLSIIESSIQDEENNSTRFVILSREKVFLKTADKITISFSLLHERGSLYNALSFLSHNDINLSLIESRPIRKVNWEYRFFIDMDGNLTMDKVNSALTGLMGVTADLKVLGNY